MQIQIANTYKPLMDLLVNWFGGGCTDKHTANRNLPCYSWRITGKENMTRFLNYIKDYVIIKRSQVKLAIVFCETLRDENLGCFPLDKNIHKIRKRVHYGLRRLKTNGK